jgi:hypothetical protein
MTEAWFLKKYRVKVDNKAKYFGSTDTKKKIITINKKKSKATRQKGEVLDSINHERLHALHPRKSEKRIIKMTEKSTGKLSKKTKGRLYKLINK